MPRSIASRLDKLEALAAELFKPKMGCFFMNDPERDPDEFRKELIATGKCSPNDDIRLVRCLTKAEAARMEEERSGQDSRVSNTAPDTQMDPRQKLSSQVC
jgi:hypothetical protein